jgi:hypothetical protein
MRMVEAQEYDFGNGQEKDRESEQHEGGAEGAD